MALYYKQTSPGTLLLLVRHGATELNEDATPRVRGWLDAQLAQVGRIQASVAAEKLRPYAPKYVYHSDFMRDCETGNIIAKALNIPAEADFDLRTWDVGIYSGKSEPEANPAIIELYKRPWETPEGSSESFNGFSKRFLDLLDMKMDMAARVPEMRPLVLVSHGRNIALSQSYLEGVLSWEAKMPLPAGIMEINVDTDRGLSCNFITPTEPVFEDR